MNTTTDLIAVRERPGLFTWGAVRKIHDIGPYTLIEYTDKQRDNTVFHVYVDGKCTSQGAATIEGGLLIAMARKHLEANEARYMALGACKLLGIKEET
jgi:hypothetical protein